MDICWTYLGSCKRVSVANHVYTFHTSLRASEFIRKMWDDEVVESLIKTSQWQKKRCLGSAKRQSQRDVLRGAMRWLFHGRTMSSLCSASERPLKTDSTLLETTLAKAKRCWKILPGDESNKAKGYIRKLVQGKLMMGQISIYLILLYWEKAKRLSKWEQFYHSAARYGGISHNDMRLMFVYCASPYLAQYV